MYDKDDDNMNIDNNSMGDIEQGFAPYGLDGSFSSPYDSIADLEKMIQQDAAENMDDDSANNPKIFKKDNNSNLLFITTVLFIAVVIVGSIFCVYQGYISPKSISALFGKKEASNEELDLNKSEDIGENTVANNKRDIGISVTTDDEFNRIINEAEQKEQAEKMNSGEMLDLPPQVGNESLPNDLVTVNVPTGNSGRMDPFNPVGANGYFDVIAPPTSVTPDEEAQTLRSVRIAGIMYTPDSPTAIINIAGADQLVHAGDSIDGFHVDRITKDKVTVRNGKNIYTASVGELVNIDSVGVRNVPNMNRKFGGPYSGKGRMIEINSI